MKNSPLLLTSILILLAIIAAYPIYTNYRNKENAKLYREYLLTYNAYETIKVDYDRQATYKDGPFPEVKKRYDSLLRVIVTFENDHPDLIFQFKR